MKWTGGLAHYGFLHIQERPRNFDDCMKCTQWHRSLSYLQRNWHFFMLHYWNFCNNIYIIIKLAGFIVKGSQANKVNRQLEHQFTQFTTILNLSQPIIFQSSFWCVLNSNSVFFLLLTFLFLNFWGTWGSSFLVKN